MRVNCAERVMPETQSNSGRVSVHARTLCRYSNVVGTQVVYRQLRPFLFSAPPLQRCVLFVRSTPTMGASESTLSSQRLADEITTVSERSEAVDPILERLKSLKISTPILTSPPNEGSLTDILVRKPSSSSSVPSVLDPKVLLELFSMYREWQEEKVQKMSKRQEEIENKIEVADALAVKLLQRFNYSVSAMKTSSQHLSEVHALQVDIGELKGRLTEVISNCDAVCRRISVEGPESLRLSVKPFAVCTADEEIQSSSSDLKKNLNPILPSPETKLD